MKMEHQFALPLRACAHGGGVEDATADTALVTVSTKTLEDYDQASKAAAHAINCHDELVAALEWYGEQARLARLVHSEGNAGRAALADDGGARARAILNKAKGE